MISIIIPFCNTPKEYIFSLINSLNDNDKTFEVIFVNDNSDNKLINELNSKIKNTNIKLVNNVGSKGVSSARNKGIDLATGKYLLFVDSDDLIDLELLKKLKKEIKDNGLLIARSDIFFDEVKTYSDELKPLDYKKPLDQLYFENDITGIAMRSACGKLFKRSIIIENNIRFDEELPFYEDAMFVSDYLKHVKTFKVYDNILYHYRMHESSSSKRFNKDYIKKYSLFFDKYSNKFSENKYLINSLYIDTIKAVLIDKTVRSFKKLHFIWSFKVVKNNCFKVSASKIIENKLLDNQFLIKLCKKINKKHYFFATNSIIWHQLFSSISIRTKRLFKKK